MHVYGRNQVRYKDEIYKDVGDKSLIIEVFRLKDFATLLWLLWSTTNWEHKLVLSHVPIVMSLKRAKRKK